MQVLDKSVEDIAKLIDADIIGNKDIRIINLSKIEESNEGDLTFFSSYKYKKYLGTTNASCIIVPKDLSISEYDTLNKAFLVTENPYISFIKIISYIDSQKEKKSGFIHSSAIIDKSSKISNTAYVGERCVIGKNCQLGENVYIYPCTVLYDNITVGNNVIIHSNVTICSDTRIGNNCIIHPGAVLGSDGFGNIENPDGSYTKIPHIGYVVLEDDVEIGANTTVDRALIGTTLIEKGVKIDNLVQVGHNVKIGENTAIASQAGISGSTKVGKRNRLAGQTGLAGHLETADDVTLLAQSGAAKSIPEKGLYFGSPVKERSKAFRIEACIQQLPEIVAEIREIKKIIKNITSD